MNRKISKHLMLSAIAAMAATGAAGQSSLPAGTPASKVSSIVVVTNDGTVKHIPLTANAVNVIQTSGDGTLNAADNASAYNLTIPMADIARIYLSPAAPTTPFGGVEGFDPIDIPDEVSVALGQTLSVSCPAADASLLSKMRVYWTFADPSAAANDCITLSADGRITGLTPGTTTVNARWASKDKTVTVTVKNLIIGDANCSGGVDINDVVAAVSMILGTPPNPFSIAAADVNGNGKVEVGDVVAIVNIVLGAAKEPSATSLNLPEPSAVTASYMVDADGNILLDTPTAIGGIDIRSADGELMAADILRRLSRAGDASHLVAYGSAGSYIPAGRHIIGSVTGTVTGLTLCDPYGRIIPATDVTLSGLDAIAAGNADAATTEVYNLSGIRVSDTLDGLAPGIYIVRRGTETRKIRIN